MTTIAFDGRYLAADSLCTTNETRFSFVKKINCINDKVVASCGGETAAALFLRLLKELDKDDFILDLSVADKEKAFNAILITQEKNILYYCDFSGQPINVNLYEGLFANGTGREFALGAMAAGKSAKEAVEIAIKFDINSGGDVTVFDTQEWCFV